MTIAIERRAARRYETVNEQLTLQLKDWAGQRITNLTLLNISESGALIVANRALEMNKRHWMQLENDPGGYRILVEPVRIGRSHEVGIRFHHPLPKDCFMAATLLKSTPSSTGSEEGTSLTDEGNLE